MDEKKHDLFNLQEGIWGLGLQNLLDPSELWLLIVITRIFNKKFFPLKLPIWNTQLTHESGMSDKTMRNTRNRLCSFLLYPDEEESLIIKYEAGTTQQCGNYIYGYSILENIDYDKLSRRYGNIYRRDYPKLSTDGQDLTVIFTANFTDGQDLTVKPPANFTDIPNRTKEDLTSSSNSTDPNNGKVENTKENERENYYDIEKKKLTEDEMRESQVDRDYEEKFQRVKKLFIDNCTAFTLGGKPRVFAFRKILEYPEEKIKRVVERAGEYGKNSSEILSWVKTGLEDYDKKYGGNGHISSGRATPKEWIPPEIVEENLNPEYKRKMIDLLKNSIGKDVSVELALLKKEYGCE